MGAKFISARNLSRNFYGKGNGKIDGKGSRKNFSRELLKSFVKGIYFSVRILDRNLTEKVTEKFLKGIYFQWNSHGKFYFYGIPSYILVRNIS